MPFQPTLSPFVPRLCALAATLAMLAATPVVAQAPERDPRPQAYAYTVVDGVSVPLPLGGAVGDAARGREVFDDPARGGCRACHAAPGLPLQIMVPRALAERAPEPEPEPEEPTLDAGDAPQAEPSSDSDSRLAPSVAAPPPARPTPEQLEAARKGEQPLADDGSGALDAAAAALLPLPVGPDLSGVAARLDEGELRLLVINPRVARAGSRMPAYHTISLAQAALTPSLRQPWLSAQEVEDVVAYLATLDGSQPAEAAPETPDVEAPEEEARAPEAPAEEAQAIRGDAASADAPAAPDAEDGSSGDAATGNADAAAEAPATDREPADEAAGDTAK